MDFYGQHVYDEESESESEAIHRLDMKVNALAQQYWWDLKPMILVREQAGHPISLSQEEEFNNLMQSLQQFWDEDEEEEMKENVKEEDDAPFEAPLLYKELQPYVPPITLPSQPEQEDATTIPYYVQEELSSRELDKLLDWVHDIFGDGEEDEEEETEENVKEEDDAFFETPLLYKEIKLYVPLITFLSRLHKSNWNKWFSELISPHFIMNIYLPLLIVCRNMLARENFF
ncbi:hypothetical protein QYF36_013000 [Acer negundo]|nr:hypothetical protein QYF36_013000 [Acer negundo]